MKYRKKPVVVEARQWTPATAHRVMGWLEAADCDAIAFGGALGIPTHEGMMTAQYGDWIIQEPAPTADRRFYPCKHDIFAASYEPAE